MLTVFAESYSPLRMQLAAGLSGNFNFCHGMGKRSRWVCALRQCPKRHQTIGGYNRYAQPVRGHQQMIVR